MKEGLAHWNIGSIGLYCHPEVHEHNIIWKLNYSKFHSIYSLIRDTP
jgi:hypothetical protein